MRCCAARGLQRGPPRTPRAAPSRRPSGDFVLLLVEHAAIHSPRLLRAPRNNRMFFTARRLPKRAMGFDGTRAMCWTSARLVAARPSHDGGLWAVGAPTPGPDRSDHDD